MANKRQNLRVPRTNARARFQRHIVPPGRSVGTEGRQRALRRKRLSSSNSVSRKKRLRTRRLSTPGGSDHRGRLGLRRPMDVMLAAILGVVLYLFSGLRVLREYERAVYFFLGRSWGAKGPGLIYLPPLFAKMQRVSLRVLAMEG